MRKRLYLLGGPMGVGKTTVCRLLQGRLPNCVFLDGDWCWDARPFTVNAETKRMVLDNIRHLLGNFLRCSAYENVLFCWVLQEQSVWDDLLSLRETADVDVTCAALLCSPDALRDRLLRDVDAGLRRPDVLARSPERLPLYRNLRVPALDTTALTPEQTADAVLRMAKKTP